MTAPAGADNSVEIFYQERPPFTARQGDSVTGLFASPINQALASAGMTAHWRRLPPIHQLNSLRANKSAHCAADWYFTKERQLFAQISVPVVRDSHYVVVTRRRDQRFNNVVDIRELNNRKLLLANSSEFSFGVELDGIIAAQAWPTVNIHGGDLELLSMVVNRRADYALILEDEIEPLLQQLGNHRDELELHASSGFPEPEFVHLLCSYKVPYATMKAINNALLKLQSTTPEATAPGEPAPELPNPK